MVRRNSFNFSLEEFYLCWSETGLWVLGGRHRGWLRQRLQTSPRGAWTRTAKEINLNLSAKTLGKNWGVEDTLRKHKLWIIIKFHKLMMVMVMVMFMPKLTSRAGELRRTWVDCVTSAACTLLWYGTSWSWWASWWCRFGGCAIKGVSNYLYTCYEMAASQMRSGHISHRGRVTRREFGLQPRLGKCTSVARIISHTIGGNFDAKLSIFRWN